MVERYLVNMSMILKRGNVPQTPHTEFYGKDSFLSLEENLIDQVCEILGIEIQKYLDTHKPYLTSEQIEFLASDGFTIGAHSKTHPRLGLLAKEDELEQEIVTSCKTIMNMTKKAQIPFAFPFSGYNVDRTFLGRLIARHEFIKLFFDSSMYISGLGDT